MAVQPAQDALAALSDPKAFSDPPVFLDSPAPPAPSTSPASSGPLTFTLNIITIFLPKASAEPVANRADNEQTKGTVKKSGIKGAILVKLPVRSPSAANLRTEVTLAKIRTQLIKSYPRTTPFRFCTEFGEAAFESMTLEKYFQTLKRNPDHNERSINIYVTAVDSGNPNWAIAVLLKQNSFCLKFMRLVNGKESTIDGSLDSAVFQGKNAAATSLNTLRGFVRSMSADSKQDTFCLPDGAPIQDSMSLEHYLGMSKPTINEKDKVPMIPIFLKKTSLSVVQSTSSLLGGSDVLASGGKFRGQTDTTGGDQSSDQSKSAGIDQSVVDKLGKMDLSFTDNSANELHRDTAKLQVTDMLNEKDYMVTPGGPTAYANKLNEDEWDIVLRNCNAFRGWIIDFKGNKIGRAPHPAFRLRESLNLDKVNIDSIPKFENLPSDAEVTGKDTAETKLEPLKHEDVKQFMPQKPQGIPSFSVTDHSIIDIAAVKHEFAMSMAENHFDKTTFEVEASGAIENVTVSAQAGEATENQTGQKSSQGEMSKTLVATYRIPRATVYLSADDLEPTKEFAAAIHKVRQSKNIVDLRKLHRMFGQIFCTEIVIGGCLQTSKTLTASELKEETLSRNKFKGSVGMAVGVPQVFSASAKATHETQDENESGSRNFDQREALSFNATGGNTVLATNPPAWLNTVGSDSCSWRVIKQGELRGVMDMISDMHGYGEVNAWFLQAVPKLAEYIIVPKSRTIDTRLTLDWIHDGISRALGHYAMDKDDQKTLLYLAHDPEMPPVPVRTFVKGITHHLDIKESEVRVEKGRGIVDVTQKYIQTKYTSAEAIFQPASTQTAVLLNPKTHPIKIGNDNAFTVDKRTVWTMEVPDGESLRNESIVILKSRANKTPGMALSLTVYRNAQGVFMPSITSQPDPVYWRIQKVNPGVGPDAGQLKFGDKIRLCWRFSDQVSGWRDFVGDLYGRRCFDRPAGFGPEQDTLYFKLPFPRFEGLEASQGISVLLSPASNSKPIVERIKLRDPFQSTGTDYAAYNLFDLNFRLDFVGNNGLGEAFDYMNVIQDESMEIKTEQTLSEATFEQVAYVEELPIGPAESFAKSVLKTTVFGGLFSLF